MNSKKAIVRPGAPALDKGLNLIEASHRHRLEQHSINFTIVMYS
jgi:hypothetical protein